MGFRITFAALVAAIVSSLASMTNSISTILQWMFTEILHPKRHRTKAGDHRKKCCMDFSSHRCVLRSALAGKYGISISIHPKLHRVFTPGILVIFLVALFWKKATTLSVLVAAIVSLFLSLGIFWFS